MLQTIANHVSDIVIAFDDGGRISFMSTSGHRVFDVNVDAAATAGASILDIVHQEDRERIAHLISSDHAGDSRRDTFRCVAQDGGVRWMEGVFHRIGHSNNELPYSILGVLRDVTERNLTEEKLRQSEAQFRGAFESAAHGVALVSTDGRWLKVNKAACSIVGYSERELLATDFQTLTHPDDLDADLELVGDLLAGEIESYQMDKRYFHKDGHIVWVSLSVSLVRDHNSIPVHFVSQIIDTTAVREAQETLRLAKEEAEAANQAKSFFMASMGKEIRKPMNEILRQTSMVLETPLSDDQRSRIELIERALKSLDALINDVVDAGEVDANATAPLRADAAQS